MEKNIRKNTEIKKKFDFIGLAFTKKNDQKWLFLSQKIVVFPIFDQVCKSAISIFAIVTQIFSQIFVAY